MLAGFAVPIQATGAFSQLALEIEPIGKERVTAESPIAPMGKVETSETALEPSSNEMVRVSIQLAQAPTIDAGFKIQNIAQNASAMHYRDGLKSAQDQMQAAIERQALDGQKPDVVWNLTLAANMISANVPRSAIARIAAMEGVKASGVTYELLDTEEIGGVLKQLNAYRRIAENGQTLTARDLYINVKAAFGYNYIDGDLDITHDHDTQGEHGTMHLLDQKGNDLVTPTDAFYQQNYWVWDMAYSKFFSTADTPAVYGIRKNAIVAPMNPRFANISMGMYGVSYLAGIAAGGIEHITYKNYYGYDAETDSEVLYLIDDQCNARRCNMFLENGYRYGFVYSVTPSDMSIRFPAKFSGNSSLVLGEDGAPYFSAWIGSTNALYRLVYDEVTESYTSTFLGDFGKDVWPAVILDASSNAAPAAGSLDAIAGGNKVGSEPGHPDG